MKRWLSNNIFAVDEHISIQADRFNHCASICPCSDGILIAWYSGSGECRDDQSVYLSYLSNGTYSPPIRIGDKTGNPIIWNESGQIWLLYSMFETEAVEPLAHRWQHCSLLIRRVEFSRQIKLLEEQVLTNASSHLLARTNPLPIGDKILLPLYDEVRRECVIYTGRSGRFEETSRFGNSAIQPAIWYDNGRLHALARNFGSGRRKSPYYYSDDDGQTWQCWGLSGFCNLNSSIAIHKWGSHHVVLWNDSVTPHRTNMTLGLVSWRNSILPWPISVSVVGKKYGAYPCFCVDQRNILHFAFTGQNKTIEYYAWNRRKFQKAFRNRNIAG